MTDGIAVRELEGMPIFTDLLRFGAVRLWMQPEDDVEFHGFPGRTLRSAFGVALRECSCVSGLEHCKECDRRYECAYGAYFKPHRSEREHYLDADELPAGVIVRFPFAGPIRFTPMDYVPMDVVMVGRALTADLAFARAINTMAGRLGIGKKRVRMVQRRLEPLTGRQASYPEPIGWDDLASPEDGNRHMVEVLFLSPVELRQKGEYLSGLDFHDLIWYGTHRIAALIDTHCASMEHKGLPAALRQWRDDLATEARGVRRVAHSFVPESQVYSSSQHSNRAVFPGFTGRAIFQGPMKQFLPILRALTYVHLGRHSTFGWGQIDIRLDLEPG